MFPSAHDGQIRVAGEVISEEPLGEGDALTHAALAESDAHTKQAGPR